MATDKVLLMTYKGSEIYVDTEVGKFSARLSDGRLIEERTLSSVRKAIDHDEPTAIIMRISPQFHSAHRETFTRSEARRYATGGDVTAETVMPQRTELNEDLIDELAALERESYAERKRIEEKYERLMDSLLAQVPPLTYGRLLALLDEDAKRKAARQ